MVNIARLITGLVFIFSGVVKANDPVGFAYKLEEYFVVLNLNFLHDYSVILSIILCALEIFLGGLLLLGYWRKWVVKGLLALVIFFTFLTFYSAFFEVVTSCGCFGDAIPLTPWQSFIKDLVLLALILVLYKNYTKITPVKTDGYTKGILTVLLVVISFGIGIYTYNYLPVVDFLPYKKGNHIPSLMVMPEGEEPDQFQTVYEMKHIQSGETKTVTDTEYIDDEIWMDENWEIIGEPKTTLVKKGYTIPISDLLINDMDGQDVTQSVINNPYQTLVVVAWNLEKTNKKALTKINEVLKQAAENYHVRTVLLTSASERDAQALSEELQLLTEVFYVDAVPLKSMVRSNPGVLLLQDGHVVDKWHFNTFPSYEKLEKKHLNK